MKNSLPTKLKSNWLESKSFLARPFLFLLLLLFLSIQGLAQPIVTVRFANPNYDCNTAKYCLDVEFHSNTAGQQLSGMNVRFWYDDDVLEYSHLGNFQGGYQQIAPIPPIIDTYPGAGSLFFNVPGPAERVVAAVDLVDFGAPAIQISTTDWTMLFEVCFDVEAPLEDPNFCPSVIWDLQEDPMDGGFLGGGVLYYNLVGSEAVESVEHLNWDYDGITGTPYGNPIETSCISTVCGMPPGDPVVTVQFANPQYDCDTDQYCLDIELQSNTAGQELFDMNVSFYYDESQLDFTGFQNYAAGYGPIIPSPPVESPIMINAFNFGGATTWLHGIIQVNDPNMALALPTNGFAKFVEVCFDVIAPNSSNFCPSVVWDLEEDPADLGYIDDGLIVNLVDPNNSNNAIPSIENVNQYNWAYDSGLGSPPYGNPVETNCISTLCSNPVITTQLSNPKYDCDNNQYCVDIELQSNTIGQKLFDINVSFYYDESLLDFTGFQNYATGYGPIIPSPPVESPIMINAFNFAGSTTWLHGIIQVNNTINAIDLPTSGWAKLVEVCFDVVAPTPDDNFCPSIVLDLEADPADLGYVDDGLIVNLVDPNDSNNAIPSIENVIQFNWAYDFGATMAPFGAPVETSCISTRCYDLALDKSVSPSWADPGDPVTFTIQVENIGPDPATGVVVSDLLPSGFAYTGDFTASGSYVSGTGEWTIGTIGVNETVTLTISATVNGSGIYTNLAEVIAANGQDGDSFVNNGVDTDGDMNVEDDLDDEDDGDGAIVNICNLTVDAGVPQTVCEGSSVTLSGSGALSYTWDNGVTDGVAFVPLGTTTYTVTGMDINGCEAMDQVTITVQPALDAGGNGTLTICEGETVTEAELFASLTGTPDAGGTWSPALGGPGTYTYTHAAVGECPAVSAEVVVTEQPALDAGGNGTLTICEGEIVTTAELFASLTGTPDAGGTWSPALGGAGTYTYTHAAVGECPAVSAEVVVTEQPALDAGGNGTLAICEGETVTEVELFASLTGTPDAGGTWSPALGGADTYTYTHAAVGECPAVSADVVVTEQPALDAGGNGTLTICEGETVTEAELFASLTGTPDAGGTWSPALGGAGTYTYTHAAVGECPAVSAEVVVTEQPALDAGGNGTLTICEGEIVTTAELFASLTGTPDAGGTWSPALGGADTYTYTHAAVGECPAVSADVVVTAQPALDAGGNGTLTICEGETVTEAALFLALTGTPDAGGTWSPALVGAGTYTYTHPAAGNCLEVSAEVVVSEQPALDAGGNGTLTICEGETVTEAELFASLTGTPDAGGTWSPALGGAGTYTYTHAAVGECPAVSADVVVTAQPALDAGGNGTLTICEGETVTEAALFLALTGTPDAGGTWSPALAGAGTYTYTHAAVGECPAVSAEVVVTEQPALDAGGNGTLTICEGEIVTTAELFASLTGTPDAGGTWSPALGGAGTYTYTHPAAGNCLEVSAEVVVSEQPALDAGGNGTLTICEGETVTEAELFASLTGTPDAGGTWSPALGGAGTYTYTHAAVGECPAVSADVVVTEQSALDAGGNGTLTICEGETVTEAELFASLTGTPDAGGTWSPALAGAGTYTYTHASTGVCPAVSADVVVTEQPALNAGGNGMLTICDGEIVTETALFLALTGTPDAGGTWSPALAGAGTYTYTHAAVGECPAVSAEVVVTEQPALDAGGNGTLTICEGETVTTAELFASLTGTPDAGGTWSPALGGAGTYTYTHPAAGNCLEVSAEVVVTEQPGLDAGGNGTLTICEGETVTEAELFASLTGTPDAGGTWSPALGGADTYTYTHTAVGECPAVSAEVVVTEQPALDAGGNGTLAICEGETVTEAALFLALTGTPDAGGTWSPALAGAGTYTYTHAAVGECPAVSAEVVVTEQPALDAGGNGTLTICEGEIVTTAELFASLTGTPDAGGTWSPALGGAGTYTYTHPAAGNCLEVSAEVVVSEQPALDAGGNGTLTICEGETVTEAELFASLTGTPDAGGTWSPALGGAGTYTYTHAAVGECPAVSAEVVVTEQPALDAGGNGTLTICEGETVTEAELFASLTGTPDAGGTWSPALGGADTYTYTHAAVGECPAVSAEVVVTEQPTLDAGGNGTLTICEGATFTEAELVASLTGMPDAGGTWSPALAGAGTYTYTHAATGECPAVSADVVVIGIPNPQLDAVQNVVACESYALPTITGTNLTGNEAYYDDSQANGGQPIAGPITNTMTVWIYDETGTMPNCSDETSFAVTINTSPNITNPGTQNVSGSYVLPVIAGSNLTGNEAYYDDSQANGGQPIAGPITSTMTVWIYDETGSVPNCSDEESFLVVILNNPIAKNDVNQTAEGTSVMGNVLTNDEDPDGYDLTVNTMALFGPTNGVLTLNSNGTYTYTPDPGFTGEDIFEYQICNNAPIPMCDQAIVVISVFGTNDPNNNPPVGISDHIQTGLNTPVMGNLLINDSDPEGGVLTIATSLVINPVNGMVIFNPDGTFTYTPNPGFVGTDNFKYKVCDDGTPQMCHDVLVTIDVLSETSPNNTIANDDAWITEQNQQISGDVTENDYDFGGNGQQVTLVSGVTNGMLSLNPDGTFVYTPGPDFIGNDQFVYEICNDAMPQACDLATVYISIIFAIPEACDPPVNGLVSNIMGTSATFTWTSVNTPVNDHCWNFYIGNEGFDCDENEEFIAATICFINDIPTSNNPLVPAGQINVNAATGVVSIHVDGLQPGTVYEWAIFETCDGFLTPNPWDCSDALFGPFQTFDDPYTVNWADVPASCPSTSPGFVPDGSFSVTIGDSPTCTGTYDVIVIAGPFATNPAGYAGVGAGTYVFNEAGPGVYTVQITETSICLPVNDPVTINVTVEEGVDVEDPVFYVTDILGNIIADNDPSTPESDDVDLADYNLPEGSCNYQEQWFVYGVDNCDGNITNVNAVSASAASLFLEDSNPGTQIIVTEDGFGFYRIDVNWDADQTEVTVCLSDNAGNAPCVRIRRFVREFNDPEVVIVGANNITIPQCADSRDVIVTVYVSDLCEAAGNIFSSGNFVANGTEVLNYQNFDDDEAGYAEFIVTVTLADDGTIWSAQFTDAFGNTGYADIQINVVQAVEDEPAVILAANENLTIPYCEAETQLCYAFQVYDDCAPVNPALLTFGSGGSGLSEDILNDFYIDINSQTQTGFFEICGVVAAGSYILDIEYDGQLVQPQLVVNQQQNQAPVVTLPGNLNFIIPVCEQSIEATIAVQFSDDCDDAINPDNVEVIFDGAILEVADATISGGLFAWTVTLTAESDGAYLGASYTDADGQTTVIDPLITVTQQPDNWAPIIVYPSQDINIELGACDEPLTQICFPATATDNCSGVVDCHVSIGGVDIPTLPDEFGNLYCVDLAAGDYEVVLEATDDAGNTRTEAFHIVITQEEVPEDNLACTAFVNVTLGTDCSAELLASTVLNGTWGCLTEDDFVVTVIDGNPDNGPIIDGCGIFSYTIALAEGVTGNFTVCWGEVTAEDKTAPTIECPAPTDVSLTSGEEFICTDIESILINGTQYYTAYADGTTVEGSMSSTLSWILSQTGVPQVGDNCGQIRVSVWDQVTESDCGYDVITRHFQVADRYNSDCTGAPMTASCTQQIRVRKPNMGDVAMPLAVVELECSDEVALTADGYPHPSETGFPAVTTAYGTYDLDDTYCNIGAAFEDSPPIGLCANSYKIIRVWTIVDWCNPVPVTNFTQVIKVGDTQPPVITCNLQDTNWDGELDMPVYSTGPFDCNAVFPIPAPIVTDNCNDYVWTVDVVIHEEQDVLDQWGQVIGTEIVEQTLSTYGPFASSQSGPYATGVPMSTFGNHFFLYTATDACGNTSTYQCEFAVVDNIAPVAICDDQLNISIGGEGFARVYAEDVDEGSHDNCSAVTIEVRRNGGVWGPYVDFDCDDVNNYVTIELQVWDASGNSNICWLEVLIEDKIIPYCHAPHDESRHCDDEELLHIDWTDVDQLNEVFGEAWAEDNCNATAVQTSINNNLNDCGWGTVVRTFRATDDWGNISNNVCQQVITVYEVHNYAIKFPKDASEECGVPNPDSIAYNTIGCDLITVNVTDVTYEATSDECYKILRTYKVINWCEWDGESDPIVIGRDEDCDNNPGDEDVWVLVRTEWNGDNPVFTSYVDRDYVETNTNPFIGTSRCTNLPKPNGHWANSTINEELTSVGHWQYTQVIKVYDFVAPTAEVSDYDVFCSETADCNGDVVISFTVEELCDLDVVTVEGFIDAYSDGVQDGSAAITEISRDEVAHTITYEIGGNYPLGAHTFGVHIEDGCHNITWLEIPFEVVDCKAPTPVCINGLTVTLMPQPDGCCAMAIWASDFIASDVVDCSEPVQYSIHKAENVADGSDIPAPGSTGLVLDCNDDSEVVILIYAWDSAYNPYALQPDGTLGGPNYDYCETYVLVQAHEDCVPPGLSMISGVIQTEESEGIEDVEVMLSGNASQQEYTISNGSYIFDVLETGFNYTVTPHLNTNPLNGVTTYDLVLITRHILGTELLDSPYKMIAADANSSGLITTADMIQIRKLILGINTEYPNNTSWRFVDADYVFPDPANPWVEEFPEFRNISILLVDMLAENFIGAKIGDVNSSAIPNVTSVEERNVRGVFALHAEDVTVTPGNQYSVTFTAEDLARMQGYQFTLNFDRMALDFEGIEYGVAAQENFGLTYVGEGMITTSWNLPGNQAVTKDTPLFTVNFTAKTEADLSDLVSIGSRITRAEAYNSENDLLDVSLDFNKSEQNASFQVYQNTPNPFDTETRIGFNLPEDELVTITVQDVTGKVLKVIHSNGQKGYNAVMLQSASLGATGILYYTVGTEHFSDTKKMILVEF